MKTDMWGKKPRWYDTTWGQILIICVCGLCLAAYAASEWV